MSDSEIYNGFFKLPLSLTCVANFEGFFIELNPYWQEVLGYSIEDLTSHPYIDFVHPEDRDSTLRAAEHLVEDQENVLHFENRYRCKDGTYKWLLWDAVMSFKDKLIYAVARDISDEKKLSNQFKQSNSLLSELLEVFPHGIYITDEVGKVTFANQKALQMLEIDEESDPFKKVYLSSSGMKYPSDQLPHIKAMDGQSNYIENAEIHRTLDTFPVQVWGVPIYDDNQHISHVISILIDITARKKSEQLLLKNKKKFEMANRSKIQFLTSMSHDIKTPLNAIIGYSEILLEEANEQKNTEMSSDLKLILKAAFNLVDLLDDIITVAFIESDKVDLNLDYFDPMPLLNEVIDEYQPLIQGNKNALETNFVSGNDNVYSDYEKLKVIFKQLVSNAAKYCKGGKITIQTNSKTIDSKNYFEVIVEDSGQGFTKENLEKLFYSFALIENSDSKQFNGTGLGLCIAHSYSRLLGGDLAVESQFKEGSRFTLNMPREIYNIEYKLSSTLANTEIDALAHENIILYIDDDVSSRDIVTRILEKEGFHVITCQTGEEGVKAAKKLRPSLILIDIIMEGLNGWEVLKKFKSTSEMAHIPVLMISVAKKDKLSFILGASDFISKPIKRDQLLSTVRKYLTEQSDHILLVDDDYISRSFMARIMKKVGISILEASNGIEAINILEKWKPQLILLDLMMPEMDGFQFLEKIEHHPEWQNIPIIILSSKELSLSERSYLNQFVETIVEKNVTSNQELVEKVKTIIGQ